jgi:hypothetical protein
MYVADFDASIRMSKVYISKSNANRQIMTDEAWEKWVGIRDKWDPERRIGGFREKTKMNVLEVVEN